MQTDAGVQMEDSLATDAGHVTQKKSMTFYLAVLACVLAFAVGGFFFYLHKQAVYFEAQCSEGEQMVMEIKYMMDELKDLPGEKDSEARTDWLGRLDVAKSNLDKFCEELKEAKPSSKYQQARVDLLEAAELERRLLDDVSEIVKAPLAEDVQNKLKVIEVKTGDLQIQATSIEIGKTDYAAAMDLSMVKDNLMAFVGASEEVERRKKEAEAREKEKAAIQERLNRRNELTIANSHELEWLATSIDVANGNSLVLHGFFYNGSINPIIRVNKMTLTVTLFKHGKMIYQNENIPVSPSGLLQGELAVQGRQNSDLHVNINGGIPTDFDEFDISMADLNWTYRR